MWGYTDVTDTSDSAMKQPLCWITNEFDRSPAELIWVPAKTWGPLAGSLLNTSYGMGKIFVVPYETVNGQAQGGMCALPLPVFPTGVMRPRFHPTDGHLYVCGMYAWAGNQTAPGGFYRVRYTGKPADLPVGLTAKAGAVELTFTDTLDPKIRGREELRHQGVEAEADSELRLEAHRREAVGGGEGHAEHGRQDGAAGPARPGPDVGDGDQVPTERYRRPVGDRRTPQHNPRTQEMIEERGLRRSPDALAALHIIKACTLWAATSR